MTAFLVIFSPKMYKKQGRVWLLWSWLGKALSLTERAGVRLCPLILPVWAPFRSVSLGNKVDSGKRIKESNFYQRATKQQHKLVRLCSYQTELKCRAINRGCAAEAETLQSQGNERYVYIYYEVSYLFLFVISLQYFSINYHLKVVFLIDHGTEIQAASSSNVEFCCLHLQRQNMNKKPILVSHSCSVFLYRLRSWYLKSVTESV